MIGSNYYTNRNSRNIYNYNKELDLIGNLNSSNLSHSIKIFNHKSNSIDLKSYLNNVNSEKNILKKNINLVSLKDSKNNIIYKKKNNLILLYDKEKKKEKEIDIKNKILEKNKNKMKDNMKMIFFPYNSYNSNNNIGIKNYSSSNLFINNKYIHFKSKKNNNNINDININNLKLDKNKLKDKIENAEFRIKLLNNNLNKANKKYLLYKLYNTKRKLKENIYFLKVNFMKESQYYQNQINFCKLKISKAQEKSININIFKDEIKKEEIIFKTQKIELIERILELSCLILKMKTNKIYKDTENSISPSENDNSDLSIDEMLISKNNNVGKISEFFSNV